MWRSLRDWFEYYVLGQPKIKQFGRYDYRVCKWTSTKACFGIDACLTNPERLSSCADYFWMAKLAIKEYAIFESHTDALDALLSYNDRQCGKLTYPKKGKFV